jgi:hypothetical protein
LEIIDVLTQRVRVLTVEQIARTWWGGSDQRTRLARARIDLLEKSGLVRRFQEPAHPELELAAPVALGRQMQLRPTWAQSLIN